MGYSVDDSIVRVDFFKPSGKWYTTEAVQWISYTERYNVYAGIHDEFANSLRYHFKDDPTRLSEFDAICLHPYHEHEHPIMIKSGGWAE